MNDDLSDIVSQRQNIFFCLFGPTGAGKRCFYQSILQDFDDIEPCISVTSRRAREFEQDTVDYFFVSADEFQQRIQRGDFFEWEEVHGAFYGTPQHTVDTLLSVESDVLVEVDIRGALSFRKKIPERVVTILILPPSFDSIEERIREQAEFSEIELSRRLATAQMEYRMILDIHQRSDGIDYLVVNDDFSTAYWTVQGIIYAERARFHRADERYIRILSKYS